MSANPQQLQPQAPEPQTQQPVSKKSNVRDAGVNVSRETLESIKRTLYNAIDKIERMAEG